MTNGSRTFRFRTPWTLAYVASIVAVNAAFAHVPLVILPGGVSWAPLSLVVGFWFILRDFAQREIGHRVLIAMAAAVVLSYLFASPATAVASASAAALSELLDWAVYSFTRLPFSKRVLYSSFISSPTDSLVFLLLMDLIGPDRGVRMFSWPSLVVMVVSKLVGAAALYVMLQRRERAVEPSVAFPST